MRNQLRLLPTDSTPSEATDAEIAELARAAKAGPGPVVRPRRRRHRGPSAAAGRIDTRTRRAGQQGVARAREALLAATNEAELRRAG